MRSLALIVIGLLMLLFSSVIIVDERQNAVVSNASGSKQIVESAGIHLAWPVSQKVTYVFINERTALLTLTVNDPEVNNHTLQVQLLINYHVINPIQYLSAVNKLGRSGITSKIAQILIIDVTNQIKSETLVTFNQQAIFSVNDVDFTSLGIKLDQVNLLNIKK